MRGVSTCAATQLQIGNDNVTVDVAFTDVAAADCAVRDACGLEWEAVPTGLRRNRVTGGAGCACNHSSVAQIMSLDCCVCTRCGYRQVDRKHSIHLTLQLPIAPCETPEAWSKKLCRPACGANGSPTAQATHPIAAA